MEMEDISGDKIGGQEDSVRNSSMHASSQNRSHNSTCKTKKYRYTKKMLVGGFDEHELRDKNKTQVPELHNFTEDLDMNKRVTIELQEAGSGEAVLSNVESFHFESDPEVRKVPIEVKQEIETSPILYKVLHIDQSPSNVAIFNKMRMQSSSVFQPVIKVSQIKQEAEKKQLDDIYSKPTASDTFLPQTTLRLRSEIEVVIGLDKDTAGIDVGIDKDTARIDVGIDEVTAEGSTMRPRRKPKYHCQICQEEFSHPRTLEIHMRECGNPRKPKINCIHPSCTWQFKDKFQMIEHFETKHGGGGEDEMEVEESYSLDMKTETNIDDPDYNCCTCEKAFTRLSELYAHERVCGLTLDQYSEEDGNEILPCIYYPSCKRRFTKKSLLNRHVKIDHSKISNKHSSRYDCSSCLHSFTCKSKYLFHVKNCTEQKKNKRASCIHPDCKSHFFHRKTLLKHIKSEHPYLVEQSSLKCQKCGCIFNHEMGFRSHTKTCSKRGRLRKTKCIHPSCTHEFFHHTKMMQHVKVEHPDIDLQEAEAEKGFRCFKCDADFRHAQSLKRHFEHCGSGSTVRKTQCLCPGCPKRFFHISSMVKHMEKDHTDVHIGITQKYFASLTDFKVWKEEEESRTFSYFSTRHSVTSDSGKSYLNFVCQYRGPVNYHDSKTITEPSRKRKQKQNKTGLMCPARMLVKESENGSVMVKYVQTHNHELSLDTLPLHHPAGKKGIRRYQLSTSDAVIPTETTGEVGEIIPGDDLETLEVSVREDSASGEIITEAVMGTDYFDYLVKPNGGYVHTIDKANQTIKLFQQRTSSRFICYKVQRSFGKEEWSWEKRKVLWQHEELRENTLPQFDGVPYILNGSKVMECEYGTNRSSCHRSNASKTNVNTSNTNVNTLNTSVNATNTATNTSSQVYTLNKGDQVAEKAGLTIGETRGPASKKFNCPAKIFLKDVIKFPEFKVEVNSRQERRIKSNLLRLALRSGRAGGERRVYIQLPLDSEHCHQHQQYNQPIAHVTQVDVRRPASAIELSPPLLDDPHWDTDQLSDLTFLHTFRVTRPVFQFLASEFRRESTAKHDASVDNRDTDKNEETEAQSNAFLSDENSSKRRLVGESTTEQRDEAGDTTRIEMVYNSTTRERREIKENTEAKTHEEAEAERRKETEQERLEGDILAERRKETEQERLEGDKETEQERLEGDILAALYYLGSLESLEVASAKFQVCGSRLVAGVGRVSEFLVRQSDKYLCWPRAQERVQIAEAIQGDCGFPGAFGALDATLMNMVLPPTVPHTDLLNYTITSRGSEEGSEGSGCGLVLQFVVDHKLTFRDVHLDAPKTGTRMQVFQESSLWEAVQGLTCAESHLVAPPVYPLAPALMTPHVTPLLSYQEAVYNQQHQSAHQLAATALMLLRSRFRRLQQLEGDVHTCASYLTAACVLHNIALAQEQEHVIKELKLESEGVSGSEWWVEGLEEVVADFGVLGGEEKRVYLTTVVTHR